MKTYEIFKGEELKIADRILHVRLLLLIHSKIYYDMDHNIFSDKKWDELARELVKLQKDYPNISEQVDWYDAFKDWDGSTGAFLPLNDPWVITKAQIVSGQRSYGKTGKIKSTVNTLIDANVPVAKVTKSGVKRLF